MEQHFEKNQKSDNYREMAVVERCPFMEVPLYVENNNHNLSFFM